MECLEFSTGAVLSRSHYGARHRVYRGIVHMVTFTVEAPLDENLFDGHGGSRWRPYGRVRHVDCSELSLQFWSCRFLGIICLPVWNPRSPVMVLVGSCEPRAHRSGCAGGRCGRFVLGHLGELAKNGH